jgi:hypothetical protein
MTKPKHAEKSGQPFDDLLVVPNGFVELNCVPSGAPMHVRVDSIAAYGPQHIDAGTRTLIGIPVQLRGQPKGESILTAHSMREFALLCIEAEKRRP